MSKVEFWNNLAVRNPGTELERVCRKLIERERQAEPISASPKAVHRWIDRNQPADR